MAMREVFARNGRPVLTMPMIRLWLGCLLLVACARGPVRNAAEQSELAWLQEQAATEGPDQTLWRARLASVAMAEGEPELAEATLRQMVGRMQDFRAEGELRAMVGAERSKEWKGDPSEKMMAFLYLGALLLEQGDAGNAVAMSKAAVLADTGTSRFQYRADFVPAYVLRALAYLEQGKVAAAEQAVEQGIDALAVRVLTDWMAARLGEVEIEPVVDLRTEEAARSLLLSALPAGVSPQHEAGLGVAARLTRTPS